MTPVSSDHSTSRYDRVTAKTVLALMAPNTWAAGIAPVVVGASLAFALPRAGFDALHAVGANGRTATVFALMLVTSLLMQSAANALNDHADYAKGTDTAENSVDLADVPLVSTNVHPRTGLRVAVGCLVAAAFTGGIVTAYAGWTLLWIGLVGAVAVVLYSSGKTPISYLPLGEVVSGAVMGLLIPLATYFALTGVLEWSVLALALPTFLTIGAILMTNNTCDIARDRKAGRRTLPILLGARRSAQVMAAAEAIAVLVAADAVGTYATWGLPAMAIGLALLLRPITATARDEYNYLVRPLRMKRVSGVTFLLALTYSVSLLIGALLNG